MKHYYVYYSYEPWGRGYIGRRECPCLPDEDTSYFGSFYDKTFKPSVKIILGVFDTREDAIAAEVELHSFYKVDKNPHFANLSRQTSTRFSGGSGMLGLKHKPETIETYKNQRKGKSKSDAHKEAIRQANLLPESREKKSKALKGMPKTEEHRRKIGKAISRVGSEVQSRPEVAQKKRDGMLSPENREKSKLRGKELAEFNRKNKFICEVTGFIGNAGNVAKHQKRLGIDPKHRVRYED
jgi:hypothetical protein